jgi:putative sterol carrier protein
MASFDELKEQAEKSFVPDGAKGLQATVQLNIEGLTNMFYEINDGSLSVGEGDHANPDLTLTFDSIETMEKVFSGDQAAAMQAFMTGKVKFTGDMALGQKLGSVFKPPK